jgi:hypothetical protein
LHGEFLPESNGRRLDEETENEALDCYRRVRDQIKDFVETLPESLNERE